MPLVCLAQEPNWVGGSLRNTEAMMSLMEQRLSMKFTDSSISAGREKMVFNDAAGKFVVRVDLVKDTVEQVIIEAPTAQLNEFVLWFEKEFLEFAQSKNDQGIVFTESVVVVRPLNTLRSSFYISRNRN